MRSFTRYIGIDYSGAATPTARLPGLRVFVAEGDASPHEQRPEDGQHWSRQVLARWLENCLRENSARTVVGIDHALSFPLRYFQEHRLPLSWDAFLDDFCQYWPADHFQARVESLRPHNPRSGNARS